MIKGAPRSFTPKKLNINIYVYNDAHTHTCETLSVSVFSCGIKKGKSMQDAAFILKCDGVNDTECKTTVLYCLFRKVNKNKKKYIGIF